MLRTRDERSSKRRRVSGIPSGEVVYNEIARFYCIVVVLKFTSHAVYEEFLLHPLESSKYLLRQVKMSRDETATRR